jgi:type III secretion protein J
MKLIRLLCVLLLAIGLSACGGIDLYSNLSEQDANEILGELARAGIPATKDSPDGKLWTVKVSQTDLPRSLERLKAAALPREKKASMGDLFQKGNLVSTPSEERARYVYAISEELSRTLSQIDGVVTARVHVVLPVNDPLALKVQPSSASVFIKHRANVDLQRLTPSIKNLVLKSIEGLTYENVSVSFFPAAVMEQPTGNPATQSAQLIPTGLEEAGFTVRDTVFLGLSVIALMLGAVIAWRLMRNPVQAAPVSATDGDPQVAR